MFGKLMSVSDDLMDRYYLLLLGEARDPALHPMEAKKNLAARLTARFHTDAEAAAARADWDIRFSMKDLTAAGLPEISAAGLPIDPTVLQLAAHAFEAGFGLRKSNSELKKQFVATGAIQLNGEKLTDPNAPVAVAAGDVLRLSKKHSVRFN
jgi:tyrosyl-tRNA synthetase